jgi:hypothetical protein
MGYEIRNNIKKGYFILIRSNKSNESFEYLLDKYEIDLNDYWVLKTSDRFRFLEKDQYKKYAGITCFKKDLFKKEYIEEFFEFLIKIDLMIKFLVKPIPPKEVLNKMKIVKS